MKKGALVFLFLIYSAIANAQNILVGSFNALHLGNQEKDYVALAKVVSKFDIVGLQEVMNEKGLNRLKNEIEKVTNDKWSYVISNKPVGSKEYKEYYAFIFNRKNIDKVESLGLYQDGKSKDFIREPFAVKVLSNKIDFVFITAHSIYGKNKSERQEEANKYHKVYKYFKDLSKEEDIILAGDFNLEATDGAFKYFKENFGVTNVLNPKNNKTTISEKKGLSNSYDNFFVNKSKLREFTGRYGVYNYIKDDNNSAVRKYISDHLPVFIEVDNRRDLDDKI